MPDFPVGGDPEVHRPAGRDRQRPEAVDLFPPDEGDLGSPGKNPPGGGHPDEEGTPGRGPCHQVHQGAGLA